MADIDRHNLSANSQSRTQRSQMHHHTHRSDYDTEGYRLKDEYRREVENCHREIETLKQELYLKNDEIEHLNGTVLLNLKKEINDIQKEKIKHYQQSERTRKQLEKLKNDNYSMQQELERVAKDRRTYFSKLEELKEIKDANKRELLESEKIIKSYSELNRKLQKEVASLKMDITDLREELSENERKLFETDSEYKTVLQRNFTMESELRSLQVRVREYDGKLDIYRERIAELERGRDELIEQIEEQQSGRHENRGSDEQKNMVEIQALMEQVYMLIEQRKKQAIQVQKRFTGAIGELERALPRK